MIFSYTCELPCETALCDADGNEVYRGSDSTVTLQNPEFWWCNGQGRPYLYRWVILPVCDTDRFTLLLESEDGKERRYCLQYKKNSPYKPKRLNE